MQWKALLGHRLSGVAALIGIWLIILGVPELRQLCRMQVRGSEYAPTTAFTPFIFWPPVATPAGELARLYPRSIEAQAKAPAQSGDGELLIATARQRYDILLREHPDNLWLLATRLRIAVQELRDRRRAGRFEDQSSDAGSSAWPTVGVARPRYGTFLDDSSGYETPPPLSGLPVPARPTPLLPQSIAPQLQQAIALARQGQKLEPNNCFYDWVLTYFLFAAQRDEDALATLEVGARKPYYDAHIKDEMRAAIAVGELGHPLALEERRAIALAQYGAHDEKLMHLIWLIMWAGNLAERRGDHARALHIYGALANLGMRMQQGQATAYEAADGLKVELGAWCRWSQRAHGLYGWRPEMSDAGILNIAGNFGTYAAAHGRTDLAAAMPLHAQTALRTRRLYDDVTNHYSLPGWHTFGVAPTTHLTLEAFRLAGGLTLLQLQLVCVTWLVATFLLWPRMRWLWRLLGWGWRGLSRLWEAPTARAQPDSPAHAALYTAKDLWRSLACSSLLVALSGLTMFKLCSLDVVPGNIYPNQYGLPIFSSGAFYVGGPLICGLLWSGGAMLRRYRPPRLSYSLWKQAAPDFAARESAHTLQLPSLCYLLAAFWVWSLTLYAALAWLLFYYSQYFLKGAPAKPLWWGLTTRDFYLYDSFLPWALTIPAIISWIIKWWWQIAPEQKFTAFATGLTWYRDLMSRWLLIGSAAYLCWLLASLPTRHRADAQLNAFLNQTRFNLATEAHRTPQKHTERGLKG